MVDDFILCELSGKKNKELRHPTICHSIDSGMVALILLTKTRRGKYFLDFFSKILGLTDDETARFISFIISLHDIGKISPYFISDRIQLKEEIEKFGFIFQNYPPSFHGPTTTSVIVELLVSIGCDYEFTRNLALCIGGHHGSIPTSNELPTSKQCGDGLWKESRLACFNKLKDVFNVDFDLSKINMEVVEQPVFFILLAGFTVFCDWVSSNSNWFPFAGNCILNFDEYGKTSKERACSAIFKLGLNEKIIPTKPFATSNLFNGKFLDLNLLQLKALELSKKIDSPFMTIIEAEPGEGKTEAGLIFADRGLRATESTGIYFAMPTRFTSDKMFMRYVNYLSNTYSDDKNINVVLAHAKSFLNKEYRKIKVSVDLENKNGEVICKEWFSDSRKKALLAPFGIGTIDQLLLAVLLVPHMFLTLFALAGKTVIIDEAHAYDVYMATILDRLIEWLKAIGCSIIVLSATLPKNRREQLISAFGGPKDNSNSFYPRITVCSNDTTESVSV